MCIRDRNYVDKVSCKEVIRYNEGADKKKVVLVDCGVKTNIIRCLLRRDVEVIRVPWNYAVSYTHLMSSVLFTVQAFTFMPKSWHS